MYSISVGTGKACINPPDELYPIHRYENFYFEGRLNDLHVRTILIDNGADKFLFVSLDCGNAPYDAIKEEISAHYGIPVDHMFTMSIHNHSSNHWYDLGTGRIKPDAELAAKQKIHEKIIVKAIYDAIDQALGNRRPAKYGYGEGTSYINCNRDKLFEDGYWMQAPDPRGFSDKTLAVLKFVDMEGKLIAAIANYCCHANVAFCVYDTDGKGKMTSGFPGIACEYIEKRYNNEPVIIWTSGAAGDQAAYLTSEGFPRAHDIDGYSEGVMTPPGTQYILQKHIGYTHAVDILDTLKTIECNRTDMRIACTKTVVELQGQKAPEGADMQLNRLLADNFVRRFRPDLLVDGKQPEKIHVEMIPDGINPMNMQLVILGDMAFVGAQAELYCEIGAHLKEESPFKKTVVVTHIGPSAGYIISDESAHHKVFQSYSKTYPGNNNKPVIDGMLGMFDKLLNS